MFKRLLASQHSNVVSRRNTVNGSEMINPNDWQQKLLAHQVDKPGIKRLASFEVENSSGGNEPEDSQSACKSAPASCDEDRITIKVKEPQIDYRTMPSRSPELLHRCQGTALDHHLRREILETQEAMKLNAAHIEFVRNSQSKLGAACPYTNTFTIGTEILAKNERLLAEVLLVLTAALKDIPDNRLTCDCPLESLA